MEHDKELILGATRNGLDIYAHIIGCYISEIAFIDENELGFKQYPNPFNSSKSTLWIKLLDGVSCHVDVENALQNGDVFDFAELHYKLKGEELLEKINSEIISRPTFSYFQAPITNINPFCELSLIDVYSRIKGDRYAQVTASLRGLRDKNQASLYKRRNFDFVTFSGSFSTRKESNLIKHSGLLVIDLDQLENLTEVSSMLLADSQLDTELLFVSPSGNGLKWVVSIDINQGLHTTYFSAISNYLFSTYSIKVDPSGRDVSRACFLSHDPEVYINPKHLLK